MVHIYVNRGVIKRIIHTYWIKGLYVKIKCLTTIVMFSKKCTFVILFSSEYAREVLYSFFRERHGVVVKADRIGACSEPLQIPN